MSDVHVFSIRTAEDFWEGFAEQQREAARASGEIPANWPQMGNYEVSSLQSQIDQHQQSIDDLRRRMHEATYGRERSSGEE